MSSSDEYEGENSPQDAVCKQLQFVKLFKKYRVLLDKSQIPSVKAEKAKAATDLLAEWCRLEAVIMTVPQLMKEISKMKFSGRQNCTTM